MNAPGGDYSSANLVIPGPNYDNSTAVASLVPELNTSAWYTSNSNCIRTDPTLISRRHTFPDAPIPRGVPQGPFGPSRICSDTTCSVPLTSNGVGCTLYKTAWPQQIVDPNPMIEVAMNHPQFAFKAGGPGTQYQLDVESQLRRLDQPLSNCQAVIPEDAPLYRNTVAPPPVTNINERVQNASNPVAAMIRSVGAEQCRIEADTVASAMSGRRFWNPTRQDTMRFDLPFAPPGIGTGAPRPRRPEVAGTAFYS